METHSPLISYGWAPLEAVRDARWKLIRAPEPELYDLRDDPGETRNLFGAHSEETARLERELDAFLADEPPREEGASRQPTPEELERLRSLGYVGGAVAATADSVNRPDPKQMLRFFHETFQNAKALLLQGRFEESIAAFRQAIEVDPGNYSLYLFLAGAYRQAGRPDLADDAYREAARLSPHSPRVWYGWGRAKLSAGAPDSASWAFRKSIELLPGSPDGWSALGESEFAAGRASEAVAAFDSAMARGGDPRSIHGWMARVYRDGLRDPGQAQKHLERYAELLGVTPDEASSALPSPAPEHLDDH
jgi:cytochrome c-type biogenesis protein CcmH/NrfG